MFCPLECEGTSPSTRCHEYPSGVVVGIQVNVTSFNATTVELVGLAVTPVTKIVKILSHSIIDK